MPNLLARESSPYLLQHANNPVDWLPWGDDALRRAKDEGKPIFLSIGYAACHWCHVMEHESFEDPAIAALMNRDFISIKVDREERPDLDQIYMNATVAMTGHGGWPMSVFLTPQGVPFYAGTYFPPTSRGGMPAFADVLRAVAEAWQHRRAELEGSGAKLLDGLRRDPGGSAADALRSSTLDAAYSALERSYDLAHGGWGGAPKFPQPMTIEFLLRMHLRTGEASALSMARATLMRMASGGIYDHLGCGFHRYATDAIWLVPHFEKMLYDNAQLARVYVHAWQVTHAPLFARVATETLDYMMREMTDPRGGFYSSQDADSEGVEGKFFVWTPAEIRAALGDAAPLFIEAYGVTERGNFEGHTILHAAQAPEAIAERAGLDVAEVERRLAAARQALFTHRSPRVRPGLDDKVLVAWNGLALAAFADAARAFDRDDYRAVAVQSAHFILKEMRAADGRLLRSWRSGRAHINAYLEDYACLIDGLLALYEATYDSAWFVEARALAEIMIERYGRPEGGFFDTSDDHETLVMRPRDLQDNATPSGSAMAAGVLLRLAAFTAEGRYRDLAEGALRAVQSLAGAYPTAFAQWLCGLDFALAAPKEVAIVGDPTAPDTRALLDTVRAAYRPNQVTAVAPAGEPSPIPLLAGRVQIDGRATAYVCENFACRLPVTDAGALSNLLASSRRGES